MTYLVVVPILIREPQTLQAEVLLHQRVHNDLFSNYMSGDLPYQLSSPTLGFVVMARRTHPSELIIVLVHLLVVFCDFGCERTFRSPASRGRHLSVLLLMLFADEYCFVESWNGGTKYVRSSDDLMVAFPIDERAAFACLLDSEMWSSTSQTFKGNLLAFEAGVKDNIKHLEQYVDWKVVGVVNV